MSAFFARKRSVITFKLNENKRLYIAEKRDVASEPLAFQSQER
jgi:hypothetical protein